MVTRNSSRKTGRSRTCRRRRRRQKDQSLMHPISSLTVEVMDVDLWISLTKQMQKLQQQQMQLVEAAVRHKGKAAEQEERAIEIGKSISQLRMRFTNTAKESESKVLDE